MIRDESVSRPLIGTEAHLRTPTGHVWVTIGSEDKAEIEHYAQRLAANDAVIQAIIPMLRAVRNGLLKRAYAVLEDEDPSIQEGVMAAINVEDGELVAMLPTVEIAAGPS